MRKIKVLIVDDSTVIRRLLSDTLKSDCEIEVVGTAANGKIALAKIGQLAPDVVTLDLEMPEMDGIETLTELRKIAPRLPVIMFSTLTSRGAQATFDALARGANDYVAKPANVGSVQAAIESVRAELVPKIKALCVWYEAEMSSSGYPRANVPRTATTRMVRNSAVRNPSRIDLVAIGASTGGPNALQLILSAIPADFPVPIVITQHMPSVFTKHLAVRLNQTSAIQVLEAENGIPLVPGLAIIAQGDHHLTFVRSGSQVITQLNLEPPENSCRPAVDVMFRSACSLYGPHVMACILTGMGQDGKRGCELIHSKGGQVVIQDQASSVVWGMPRAVFETGLADIVLPLDQIPAEICRRADLLRSSIRMKSAGVSR